MRLYGSEGSEGGLHVATYRFLTMVPISLLSLLKRVIQITGLKMVIQKIFEFQLRAR